MGRVGCEIAAGTVVPGEASFHEPHARQFRISGAAMINVAASILSRQVERHRTRRAIALAALLLGLAPAAAPAETLITTEEAALANTKVAANASQQVSGGPAIEQVLPAPGTTVTSPFRLTIKFTPREHVPLEMRTATLIYAKAPLQDLTDRVGNYMTAAGIDIPAVEAPPGEHWLRVRISDEHLHWTTAWIKVTVAPKSEHTAAATQ
jgi:hypothetical protein